MGIKVISASKAPRANFWEKNAQDAVAARKGRAAIQRTSGIMTKLNLSRMIFIKKGMPTAIAVHRRGTSISREGSFWALQFTARIAAPGMSQRRAKLAKSAEPENIRRDEKRAHTRMGRTAGRLTISIQMLAQRENPKPPGLIKDPRRN
jgi:hypothetical protein